MREFSNHAVLSMSNSKMAVSSKYTQDPSFQIASFTFFLKMVSLILLLGCNLSYIVDLFAGLPELASASARTLLKLASSVRALLKPYGDTLRILARISKFHCFHETKQTQNEVERFFLQLGRICFRILLRQ